MNITNVKITKLNTESKLTAMASVTIDGAIAISGIKVIAGAKGLFVSMPNRQGKDGEYHDTVYPVTSEVRKQLNEAVLDAYKKDLDERDIFVDPVPDVKFPWDVGAGAAANESPSQNKDLADIPLKTEKTSVKAQLEELSNINDSKQVKPKTIKPKKEEVTL